MAVFNNCVYDSWTEGWLWKQVVEICLESFELEGNEWLESLFEDRKYRVSTYLHEGYFLCWNVYNSAIRKQYKFVFLTSMWAEKTSLKEFVDQYWFSNFKVRDFERDTEYLTSRNEMEQDITCL